MDALSQSGELMRRSNMLIARAKQARVTAAENIEESRQLIATAHEAQDAMMRAHGWVGRNARATVGGLPHAGGTAALLPGVGGW